MVRLCINKYRICEIYFEKFDNKNVKRFKFWFWNSISSVTVGLQEHGIGTVIFKINWSQCNPNRMLYLEELNLQLFFQFSFILNKPQNWWNRLSFSKELSRCHKILYYLYPCNLRILEVPEFIVRNIYGIQHCKDIGIRKSDFVANTQFFCQIKKLNLF